MLPLCTHFWHGLCVPHVCSCHQSDFEARTCSVLSGYACVTLAGTSSWRSFPRPVAAAVTFPSMFIASDPAGTDPRGGCRHSESSLGVRVRAFLRPSTRPPRRARTCVRRTASAFGCRWCCCVCGSGYRIAPPRYPYRPAYNIFSFLVSVRVRCVFCISDR